MAYVPKYLLRWRYQWHDKPDKYGMWSHAGEQADYSTKAWCHNKDGLKFAIVEAKDFVSREIKPIVVCDGQDFRNFQWVALAVSPMSTAGGKIVPFTRIGGLKVMTRNEEITVFDTGLVHRAPFKAENINFATYGK